MPRILPKSFTHQHNIKLFWLPKFEQYLRHLIFNLQISELKHWPSALLIIAKTIICVKFGRGPAWLFTDFSGSELAAFERFFWDFSRFVGFEGSLETTFKDVQMMLEHFFDISTGSRYKEKWKRVLCFLYRDVHELGYCQNHQTSGNILVPMLVQE